MYLARRDPGQMERRTSSVCPTCTSDDVVAPRDADAAAAGESQFVTRDVAAAADSLV